MELIDQHTKAIMEECKRRARAMGLRFDNETLEYIVTNRDLIELSPKVMIPTLYDYWVHDVEVLREKGKYELYPHNPYETVINTRPAISFYNDNNPDWLNVMIFYHVLGHIDFFQNNCYFRHTWDFDFTARALSDKRMIAALRSQKGRWVDYVIEFARAVDNLVDFFGSLTLLNRPPVSRQQQRLDYYLDIFLQTEKKVSAMDYVKEVERYNRVAKEFGEGAEDQYFAEIRKKYPEFDTFYEKNRERGPEVKRDVMQFLLEYSPFLNKEENKWMKSVVEVVRNTSLVFQPQIRSKIMNEGWASYWHETLFMADERIRGNEVSYARVNAGVTAMPRVGLNPYALGMRLFQHIEENANKGKYSYEFQRINDSWSRRHFDKATGTGREFIAYIRENYCDFMFVNTFLDQDFVDRHQLFVVGKRLNRERMVWEYYVKSRKAEDYKQMVLDSLYHPPRITVETDKSKNGALHLNHLFEGKPLYRDYIPNTMLGIEFLWGGTVHLETSDVVEAAKSGKPAVSAAPAGKDEKKEFTFQRVLYTMEKRKLSRKVL